MVKYNVKYTLLIFIQVSIILLRTQTIPVASWSSSSSLPSFSSSSKTGNKSTICMNSLLRHARNKPFLPHKYKYTSGSRVPQRGLSLSSSLPSLPSLPSPSSSPSPFFFPFSMKSLPLSVPSASPSASPSALFMSTKSSSKAKADTSPSPSSSSPASIAKSLSRDLINYNKTEKNSNIKLSMAIAGGGSSAITTLTSTNSASSTFITGNVLYDRYSFAHYVASSFDLAAGAGAGAGLSTSSSSSSSSIMIPSIFSDPTANFNMDTNIEIDMKLKMKMDMTNDRNGLFGYCSTYSSLLLSYSSLKSTFLYSKPSISTTVSAPTTSSNCEGGGDGDGASNKYNNNHNNDYNNYIGVGCTSALVSQSKEERHSKIYITITNGFGQYTSYKITLDNGLTTSTEQQASSDNNGNQKVTKTKMSRRNRQEEEDVVGAMILWCTHHYLRDGGNSGSDIDIDAVLREILDRNGDSITINECQQLSFGAVSGNDNRDTNDGDTNDDDDDKGSHDTIYSTMKIIDAANHVLQQSHPDPVAATSLTSSANTFNTPTPKATAVILAPNYRCGKVIPTAIQSVLPPNPIIFPGSFNPVHFGHVGLAKAAMKAMGRKTKMELLDYSQRCSISEESKRKRKRDDNDNQSLLECLWNTTEYLSIKDAMDSNEDFGDGQICQVFFELSLTNPDKPSMDPDEVARRIDFFNGMINDCDEDRGDDGNEQGVCADIASSTMPNNWGILLTSAPLFIDKVRLLRKYLAPSAGTYNVSSQRKRLMTFVIGTDTMVRIINPKYYGNDLDTMLEAVREMGDLGAHFVVGGRLEQSQSQGNTEDVMFVTGEEELADLPEDVRDMFTIIKEEDFRIDISSSEIRARTNN